MYTSLENYKQVNIDMLKQVSVSGYSFFPFIPRNHIAMGLLNFLYIVVWIDRCQCSDAKAAILRRCTVLHLLL